MAEKRCIDVDFAWVSGLQQQQATAEMTIGRVLGAAGWTYQRSNRSSQRYCWGGDGFDEALGEAQQTVGEWLALRWEERGGRRMRPAAPLTEVQREAHRIVGSWVVTLRRLGQPARGAATGERERNGAREDEIRELSRIIP